MPRYRAERAKLVNVYRFGTFKVSLPVDMHPALSASSLEPNLHGNSPAILGGPPTRGHHSGECSSLLSSPPQPSVSQRGSVPAASIAAEDPPPAGPVALGALGAPRSPAAKKRR